MQEEEDNDDVFVYRGGYVPSRVTKLRIHGSVKTIPDLEFSEREKLLEVYIDEGVEKICYGAFNNCKSIRRIKFPSTLRFIAMLAFNACLEIEDVEFNDGLKVIQEWAFSQCLALKRINIPSSLLTMGKEAFKCTGVKEVIFPPGPRRIGIGYGSFSNCTDLERVVTPLNIHLMSINHRIFSGCTKLESVELIGVQELISSLCIEQVRRTQLETEMQRINQILPNLQEDDDRKISKLHEWMESINYNIECSKRRHNKMIKESLAEIELGLWKVKLDEENVSSRNKRKRGQCRVNCGADVVIKNVLPFLTLFN